MEQVVIHWRAFARDTKCHRWADEVAWRGAGGDPYDGTSTSNLAAGSFRSENREDSRLTTLDWSFRGVTGMEHTY